MQPQVYNQPQVFTPMPMPVYYQMYPMPVTPAMPIVGQQGYLNVSPQQGMLSKSMGNPIFEDSIDKEYNKQQLQSKQLPGRNQQSRLENITDSTNIFKPGNHANNFSLRSISEVQLSRQKQNEYAQMLEQQMQLKKDLYQEKKQLETKHDLALKLERQQNDLLGYNRPTRDIYGNTLQSRSMPGNRNYQQQDWFTHLPNIDAKYLPQDSSNIFSRQPQEHSRLLSQQYLPSLPNSQYTNTQLGAGNGKSLQFNFPSRSLIIKSPQTQSQPYLQQSIQQEQTSSTQFEDDPQGLQSYEELDETAEDDSRKVRIMTPTKYRNSSKGCQTPAKIPSAEEQEYSRKNNRVDDYTRSSQLMSQSNMYTPSTQAGNTTSFQRIPTATSNKLSAGTVRFTDQLTGKYNYANEYEKQIKRSQYIELQNEQIKQMEEKRRQKELQITEDKRSNHLENLRIERERMDIYDNEQRSRGKGAFRYGSKYVFDEDLPTQLSSAVKTVKTTGKRPRTPIEDVIDPFNGVYTKHFILKEIPLKVKEQVTEAVKGETSQMKSDMNYQNNSLQHELNSIKDSLATTNQLRSEQEEAMGNMQNQINLTRFVDEIRRREINQKLQQKIDSEKVESQPVLLQNPGHSKFDLDSKKRVFFDYDDPYGQNQDAFNQDITSIIKDGEMPSDQYRSTNVNVHNNTNPIRNNSNYVTYEDNFEKSMNEILDNQQTRIEQRLSEMGLSSQNKGLSQNLPLKTASPSIQDSQMRKSEVDDIYRDLIKGNQENSKVFKTQRDANALDIEDYVLWNSKKA